MSIKFQPGYLYEMRCGLIVEFKRLCPYGQHEAEVQVFKAPKGIRIDLNSNPIDPEWYTIPIGNTVRVDAETGRRGDAYRGLDVIRAIEP
jgi:hypothetical protein